MVRSKSKANLYDAYTDLDFDHTKIKPLSLKNLSHSVIDDTLSMFALNKVGRIQAETQFKNKLYHILDRYTFTPKTIQTILDCNDNYLDKLTTDFLEQFNIGGGQSYYDAKFDLTNMAEKYISINHSNKKIFIEDRNAYPLKLKAKDEEESSVEQTSALEEPLQSKAVFFDNKKMLQKAKACEGVTFSFNRKDRKYYSDTAFKVSMNAISGYCTVKFSKFTDEEDINNVLFQIVDAI